MLPTHPENTVPVWLSGPELNTLLRSPGASATLKRILQRALHEALRREAGREALTHLPEGLLAAISLQVAETEIPLEELQGKAWAREIALWLEKSAYLLLISPSCQRPGLSGWSLDVVPDHQSYQMAPSSPRYEGVSLGFFETEEAALAAAKEWGLPFLKWQVSGEHCCGTAEAAAVA